jgi:hypothetical protein
VRYIRVPITSSPNEVPAGETPASQKLANLQKVMGAALHPGRGYELNQWEVIDRLLRDADVSFYCKSFPELLAGRKIRHSPPRLGKDTPMVKLHWVKDRFAQAVREGRPLLAEDEAVLDVLVDHHDKMQEDLLGAHEILDTHYVTREGADGRPLPLCDRIHLLARSLESDAPARPGTKDAMAQVDAQIGRIADVLRTSADVLAAARRRR